jgi:hypothetical protein
MDSALYAMTFAGKADFGGGAIPTGATLVTGDQVPPGTKLQLTADWPADFKDGQHHEIIVAGKPVTVSFEKIDNI